TIGGKALLRQWLFVEESAFSVTDVLSLIFLNTESSPVFATWYLFVLVVFAPVTPLLFRPLRGSYAALLPLAIAFYFIEAPDIAYLNRILSFYLFFVLGGVFASGKLPMGSASRPLYYGLLAVFILSLIPGIERFWALLLCGVLSCFAIPRLVVMAR